jgi:carbamoyl-phosphate synthase large subunit
MKEMTVLITGAGTATCQSVIKGFRTQDEFAVRIVTVDMNAQNAGRRFSDAFYTVPAANDPQFLPTVLDVCRQEHVQLLIPIVDYEFATFAENRGTFADIGCRVLVSEPRVIQVCNDKWQAFQFFTQRNVPTPQTWLPDQLEGQKLDFPLFVKPRLMGRASIDAYRVASAAELAMRLGSIDQPIVQPAVGGQEYTVDVLCDFQGRALNGVVRQRIETKSGVSYKGRTVRDRQILDDAVRIAEMLPICGPVNIQCFRDGDQVWFIEINPRFSGALALSIAAGFNSPHWLLKLLSGQSIQPSIGAYQDGVVMLRYWQEVFTDAAGGALADLKIVRGGCS